MDALSLLLACSAGILNYFRCRTSVPLKSQGGEGRALLPFCPSPGLVSQLFPENLSPTGHFLTAFRSPSCLSPWLSSSAWGPQDSLATPAQGPTSLLWQWVGRVSFSFSISFLFCFVCVFVVVVQFTHSRTVMLDCPSFQQLSDPPTRRPSEPTRNKQCRREISKCIQRNVLLQRQ